MRKLLLSICMLASIHAHAQWKTFHQSADDLTGDEEMFCYEYTSPYGIFLYAPEQFQYVITAHKSIFNYEYAGGYQGCSVIVGLYDAQQNLQERITMWLDSPSDNPRDLKTRNAGSMSNPVGQKKKVKKIINHLENTDGYVRIVAPLYGEEDFDITIPSRKQ